MGQGVEIHGEFSGSIDISLVGSGRRRERGYSELQRCHCCLVGNERIYISLNVKILVLQIELQYYGFRYNSSNGLVPNRSFRQQILHVCIAPSSTEQVAVLLLIRLPVLENVLDVFGVAVAD